MPINYFETSFEARERRAQIENLYHGETVDLVAVVTTDGVPKSLDGYTATGVFQPTSMHGSDDFYELSADIVDNHIIVHWTPGSDFGEDSYMVWVLVTKEGDAAYPITWRLDMAYSPNFPLSALDPIPKTIDFSKYDLLNAPWTMLSDFQDLQEDVSELSDGLSAYAKKEDIPEVEGKYLPLSGGTVTGALSVDGTFESSNFKGDAGTGIMIGYNAKAKAGSIAIGSSSNVTNAHYDGSNVAIGTSAKIGSSSETDCAVAIGTGATVNGNYGIAIGHAADAEGDNSIAIGSSGSRVRASAPESIQIGGLSNGLWTPNNTPHSLKVFDKMVLSGDNLTLDPERVPYLSGYAKKEDIPEVPTDLSAFTNSPGYLTAHQSLSDYYTKEEADGKFLTAHQDLTDYATKGFVQSEISDFITEDALTGLATKEELTAYATETYVQEYVAEHAGTPADMSACLSSAEFDEIEELPNDGSASLSSIIAKIDEVIRALKRANQPEPPSPLPSADYYVATYGSDTNDGSQDAPFATIQRAINACSGNGEKILVRDGTYSPITADNLDISIVSENGPDTTIIDGLSSTCCVKGNGNISDENINLKVIGFTIQNGIVNSSADDGAGVRKAKLDRCVVKNCIKQSYGSGGGIAEGYAYNTLFIDCYAASNGGGANSSRITNCTFINCTTANRNVATTGCWARNCLTSGQSFASDMGRGTYNCSSDGAACFVDAANGDYRLKAGSSAVNAGSADYLNENFMTDLDGNPRLVGDAPDQGCYEFQG